MIGLTMRPRRTVIHGREVAEVSPEFKLGAVRLATCSDRTVRQVARANSVFEPICCTSGNVRREPKRAHSGGMASFGRKVRPASFETRTCDRSRRTGRLKKSACLREGPDEVRVCRTASQWVLGSVRRAVSATCVEGEILPWRGTRKERASRSRRDADLQFSARIARAGKRLGARYASSTLS